MRLIHKTGKALLEIRSSLPGYIFVTRAVVKTVLEYLIVPLLGMAE